MLPPPDGQCWSASVSFVHIMGFATFAGACLGPADLLWIVAFTLLEASRIFFHFYVLGVVEVVTSSDWNHMAAFDFIGFLFLLCTVVANATSHDAAIHNSCGRFGFLIYLVLSSVLMIAVLWRVKRSSILSTVEPA